MKTFGILFSVFLAQSSHAYFGDQLDCKATGKVDGIIELSFQETDLESQNCGYYKVDKNDGTSEEAIFTCFNGSIYGEENEIASKAVSRGDQKITIRNDAVNGYRLVKVFICDFNHEESCIPGMEEVLVEEKLECKISKIKI